MKFSPGDRVRVIALEKPGHVRTPAYVRDKYGWIERIHGEFRNPERVERMHALIRLMRYSGLAIQDAVTLERVEADGRTSAISHGVTNVDGRVAELAPLAGAIESGENKIEPDQREHDDHKQE